jgi:hypothetical protein
MDMTTIWNDAIFAVAFPVVLWTMRKNLRGHDWPWLLLLAVWELVFVVEAAMRYPLPGTSLLCMSFTVFFLLVMLRSERSHKL